MSGVNLTEWRGDEAAHSVQLTVLGSKNRGCARRKLYVRQKRAPIP